MLIDKKLYCRHICMNGFDRNLPHSKYLFSFSVQSRTLYNICITAPFFCIVLDAFYQHKMSFFPLQLVKGVDWVMFIWALCISATALHKKVNHCEYSQSCNKSLCLNVPEQNISWLFNFNNAMDDFCKIHVLGESVYQHQEKQLFRLSLAALLVTVEHQTLKTNTRPQNKISTL